jgi:hypothetical protein
MVLNDQASGGTSGGPDFKNLDKWVWFMTNGSSFHSRLSEAYQSERLF